MKITDVSIDNRTSIFILVFIIIIFGITSYNSLPREASPDVQIPLVIVSTPYFGVSPEDIESLITQPIEKEISTISEVKELRSASFEGFSLIQAEFQSGFDIDEALQKIRDKVQKAESELPDDVEKPEIIEINFSEFPIMTYNISGPYGLVKLKDIADDLKDEIENINGVLEVKISGGLEREVKVDVDANKLMHYNLRFDDIIEAIQNENRTIPGGSIDLATKSFLVRVPGEFDKPYIIQDLIAKMHEGKPIYIRDVAEVSYSFKDRTTYARVNGVDAVTLNISKRVGANIIEIADKVKEVIANAKSSYPDGLNFNLTVDFSKDIKESNRNLENNIFSGLVLVLIVLLFFLGIRNALFVAIAIPLSMLISFTLLSAFGFTLNFIVLFSLILALGMLVDNAIVVIENIYKFLEEGYDLIRAAKTATAEVAWPITTSTLTTVLAFLPMTFWPGVVGDFMFYLPITVIITLTSSLFVALIINPVFASKFMKVENPNDKADTLLKKLILPLNKLTHFFVDVALPVVIRYYEKFLKSAVGKERDKNQKVNKRNWFGILATIILIMITNAAVETPEIPNVLVLIISTLLGVGIIYLFLNPRLKIISGTILLLIIISLVYREFDHGVEFFPNIDPPRVYVNIESPTGTNIDMSNRIAKSVEQELKQFAEVDVKDYVANVGSSNNPFDGGSSTPNKSTITVQYIDYDLRSQSSKITTDQIREAISKIPGAEYDIQQEAAGPPVGKPVNIEISGDDFTMLGVLADQVKDQIKEILGVVDIQDDYDAGRPEVRVIINREKAALLDMNTSIIANSIRTAINGFEASNYRVNEDEYDITVRLKEDQRNSIDALNSLRIIYNDKKGNTLDVPLSSVAEISRDRGPGSIRRVDLKRVVTVSSNVKEGFNQNEVLDNVKAKLASFNLPQDYKIDYTGQNEEQEKAQEFLGRAFMIALLSIFLVLVIQFNSLSQPLIIMAAVIISLIGVLIGLTLFGMAFGIIMTGIGVISLAGVIVNNNIVLIDYVNILRNRGLSVTDSVIRAGLRRFRPVTLTAITTILGLIPLTFGFGFDLYTLSFQSGGTDAEFWRQMGVAVIFGLLFGTVLTLIIVPVIYTIIYDLPDVVRVTKESLKNWLSSTLSKKK
ncbi:MAG: efflux RND transporter permease subunit [Melioribacteraceae bacterium]|nr:MAG: efflux RND transporter permease subunit [Melioribacteraceae bacterium]